MLKHFTERHWRFASIIALVFAVAGVYWPGTHSRLVLDDYFLVVLSRLVDDPFPAFMHNHFPVGLYYRPFAMFMWWLSVEIFGTAARWHYLVNLALHAAVSIALWRVLSQWISARCIVFLSALAFAVHPIAIGTSLWLADRFDLIATLLSLLAIAAATGYRRDGGRIALLTTFATATLAALSKEIAFAAFVAIILLWAWPMDNQRSAKAFFTPLRKAAIVLTLLAMALIGWRSFLLSSASPPPYLNGTSLLMMLLDGASQGAKYFFVYLLQLSRLNMAEKTGELAAVAGFFVWLSLRLYGGRVSILNKPQTPFVAAAAGLLLATIVLQAPIIRISQLDLTPTTTGVWIAFNSRFFYFSLIAFLMLVAALFAIASTTGSADQTRSRSVNNAILLALVVMSLVPSVLASRRLAHHYKKESQLQASLLENAARAVAKLALPKNHCQVYFLDVQSIRAFEFMTSIDSAIKTLSPDIFRVQHCLFQTETTPAFQLFRRGSVSHASALPMRPRYRGGEIIPWVEYGNVGIGYLNLLDGTDPTTMKSALFLGYDQGNFHDVTEDVLAGKRPVKFHCGQEPAECAASANFSVGEGN